MQEKTDIQNRDVQSVPYFVIVGQQLDDVQDVPAFKTAVGATLGIKPAEFLSF